MEELLECEWLMIGQGRGFELKPLPGEDCHDDCGCVIDSHGVLVSELLEPE